MELRIKVLKHFSMLYSVMSKVIEVLWRQFYMSFKWKRELHIFKSWYDSLSSSSRWNLSVNPDLHLIFQWSAVKWRHFEFSRQLWWWSFRSIWFFPGSAVEIIRKGEVIFSRCLGGSTIDNWFIWVMMVMYSWWWPWHTGGDRSWSRLKFCENCNRMMGQSQRYQ